MAENWSLSVVLHGQSWGSFWGDLFAFKKAKISCIPDWPANSPDVNPAENVWTRAEPLLRKSESGRESFEEWRELIVPAIYKYPAPEKLVGAMAKRCRECIEKDGAMLDH